MQVCSLIRHLSSGSVEPFCSTSCAYSTFLPQSSMNFADVSWENIGCEACMSVMVHFVVVGLLIFCSLVTVYQHFETMYCLDFYGCSTSTRKPKPVFHSKQFVAIQSASQPNMSHKTSGYFKWQLYLTKENRRKCVIYL
jgi:hypothetical protein